MSDDLTPYAADQLDELLSAEIDGELDAAASDLGVGLDEVTARLRATPGADDRRAALAAARDLMAEPPEIDELLAQRLRAKAIRVAVDEQAARALDRRRRRRQLVLGASGVAAAAVAVVALAGALNSTGARTDSASAKRAEAPAHTATEGAGSAAKTGAAAQSVVLGRFTDKRALATQAISRSASYAAADAVTPGPTERQVAAEPLSPSTTASPVLGAVTTQSAPKSATGNGGAGGQSLDVAGACPTPTPLHEGDTLVLRATATLSGKPVLVFVFAGGGEHSVQIENTNCRLVDIQMQG